MVLSADEYARGGSTGTRSTRARSSRRRARRPAPTRSVSVIPSPAEFAGMPNPRWWQIEDAAVDLGYVPADATDLAKIVVAEFALLYGNNWFVIPYRQEVGTLAEIQGIVVTDVFGRRTLVSAATGSSGGRVDAAGTSSACRPAARSRRRRRLGQHLFLAPALAHGLERSRAESVAFLRDETADLRLGRRSRACPTGSAAGRTGASLARRFRAALQAHERALEEAANGDGAPPATSDADGEAPRLRYVLGTSFPRTGFPSSRSTSRARRARSACSARRCRASCSGGCEPGASRDLGPSRSASTATTRRSGPTSSTRRRCRAAGVVIDGAMQRARWLDGRTVVWHGRRRRPGRGEGGCGAALRRRREDGRGADLITSREGIYADRTPGCAKHTCSLTRDRMKILDRGESSRALVNRLGGWISARFATPSSGGHIRPPPGCRPGLARRPAAGRPDRADGGGENRAPAPAGRRGTPDARPRGAREPPRLGLRRPRRRPPAQPPGLRGCRGEGVRLGRARPNPLGRGGGAVHRERRRPAGPPRRDGERPGRRGARPARRPRQPGAAGVRRPRAGRAPGRTRPRPAPRWRRPRRPGRRR